jgi:alanine racemase
MNLYADSQLHINLAALRENYLILKSQLKTAQCAATIKADAYGLGCKEVAQTLYDAGCRQFFVATLGEAIYLREILADVEIYVFHGLKKSECAVFFTHNLIPVLNDLAQIQLWNDCAKEKEQKLPAIIHVDTGIHRLGLSLSEAERLISPSKYFANLEVKYLMSHLACANNKDSKRNDEQLVKLKSIAQKIGNYPLTIANSSAVFLGEEYQLDLCRPGAALFGVNPMLHGENPMHQVVNLQTRIIQISTAQDDGFVGYGDICPIKKGTRFATIPIGYADGYSRSLSNKGKVYFKGHYLPILGNISMDMTIIDVSDIPEDEIKIGDMVEVIGEHITIGEVARIAGTIAYEILTSFGCRFQKIYSN